MHKIMFWVMVVWIIVAMQVIFCGLGYIAGFGIDFFWSESLINHFGLQAIVWLAVFRGLLIFVLSMIALGLCYFFLYDQIKNPGSDLREDCLGFYGDRGDDPHTGS